MIALPVSDQLAAYLAERDRQHQNEINRALSTLRPYERRLVREAAVMGYYLGKNAPPGDPIPLDSEVVARVVESCIGMAPLYPYLAAAARGERRRVTRARLWPGEVPAP